MKLKLLLIYILIFIAFSVLSVVFCSRFFSWQDLSGHAMTKGDPALNAWALQWVSHSLVTNPVNIFNGNAFFPNSNSIALSEHLFSLAVVNVLFRGISGSPWFGYNLTIFLSYIFSCIGGFFLIKYLTNSITAGFLGGVFWGFMFFRIHHIGHLNILSFQWIPFITLFLISFLKKPTKNNTILLLFFFIMQSLVSWYLAIITIFIVILIFLCMIHQNFLKFENLKYSIFSVLTCGIVLFIFAIPYLKTASSSSLNERIINTLSSGDNVSILDYITPPKATYLGQFIPNNPYWIWDENTLFIGFIPLLLSCVFVLNTLKNNSNIRILILGISLILSGLIFSSGFYSHKFNTPLPLFYIAKILPFLSAIRATQRFSLMIYLGVLILSGLGLKVLLKHCRTPVMKGIVGISLSIIFIVEVFPYKLPFNSNNQYHPSVIDQFIATHLGEKASEVRLLHYPIFYFLQEYPVDEAKYMVDSTLHWAKIVNGFSGEVPHRFMEDMKILNKLPDDAAVAWLQKYNIDLIAIHEETPDEQRRAILNYFRSIKSSTILEFEIGKEYLIDLRNVL
ncbi:MAG: hypothetical protein RH949_19390 [Coleofasciculus sp. A1-SPW-01]|uniref:hypothetical protein n=1 Tax=Coleofasciculus sp. A1-SPW-01 TaxID=3070819 RepID=UPI0032F2EBE2